MIACTLSTATSTQEGIVDDKLVEQVVQAIDKLVRAEGSWHEKHAAIIDECSSDEETNLHEFLSWFGDANGEEDEGEGEENENEQH